MINETNINKKLYYYIILIQKIYYRILPIIQNRHACYGVV